MDKVTNAELGRIKRRILEKVGPASNKVQITDLNAVKLYGFKDVYVAQYLARKAT